MAQYVRVFSCIYCNSTAIIRRGKVKSLQRYQCKQCNKTFRETSQTALHHMHKKEKAKKYIEAMQKGMSVRKAAKYVGISKNTSFAWRHKFLSSLSNSPKPIELNTVASTGLITLPYSCKGRKKPPEQYTMPTITLLLKTDSHVWLHRINKKQNSTQIADIISNRLQNCYISSQPVNILSKAIKKQNHAKSITNSFTRKELNASTEKQKQALLKWMEKFKGVASKYLQHYWEWFVYIQKDGNLVDSKNEFFKHCISSQCIDHYQKIKTQ